MTSVAAARTSPFDLALGERDATVAADRRLGPLVATSSRLDRGELPKPMRVALRNWAVWRADAAVGEEAWEDCLDMPGAQAAVCDYAPAGWPEGTRTVVRRVRVHADQVRSDPGSRRGRTIRPDQLAVALGGETTDIYAYSFICTNLTGTAEMNRVLAPPAGVDRGAPP